MSSVLKYIERKNDLTGVMNPITGETQFNNIAGFDPVYMNAGKLHSSFKPSTYPTKNFKHRYEKIGLNEKQIKERWHKDLLKVLYNVFHKTAENKNKNIDVIVTSLNEEWHNYKVHTDGDEFVTLCTNCHNTPNSPHHSVYCNNYISYKDSQ